MWSTFLGPIFNALSGDYLAITRGLIDWLIFRIQNLMATCPKPVFKSFITFTYGWGPQHEFLKQPVVFCRSSGTPSSRLHLSQAVSCGVRLWKTFGIGKASLNLRTCTWLGWPSSTRWNLSTMVSGSWSGQTWSSTRGMILICVFLGRGHPRNHYHAVCNIYLFISQCLSRVINWRSCFLLWNLTQG